MDKERVYLDHDKYNFSEEVLDFMNKNEKVSIRGNKDNYIMVGAFASYMWLYRGFYELPTGFDKKQPISIKIKDRFLNIFFNLIDDYISNMESQNIVGNFQELSNMIDSVLYKEYNQIKEEDLCNIYYNAFYLWKEKLKNDKSDT